ncbi:MAG: LysE family translocator [Deinococcota bacterium]
MIDTTSLLVFIAAALALLVAPGPAVLYIVARSLEQGRLAGFVSVLGIASASLIHTLFAALGISALLMQSALAFSAVKYLGAAYLIYLGVRRLLQPVKVSSVQTVTTMKLPKIFMQGLVVNLFNPETALFFLAFLPQFASPERGAVGLQIVMLGFIFISLAVMSDGLYALVAGTARQLLAGNVLAAKVQKYVAGTTYIALGVTAAFTGHSRSE